MKYLLALGILLMTLSTSSAGVVRLVWDYTGEGHRGFRLYYGKTSHAMVPAPGWVLAPVNNVVATPAPYDYMVEITDPGAREHEMVLPEGTYYFRLSAIGEQRDSVFTAEEPMAVVGVDAPTGFKVEWIITKTVPIGREENANP